MIIAPFFYILICFLLLFLFIILYAAQIKADIITPVSGFMSNMIEITARKAEIPVMPDVNADFKYRHIFCCHIPIIRITAHVGTGVLPMNLFKRIIIIEQIIAQVTEAVIFSDILFSGFSEGYGATEPVNDIMLINAPFNIMVFLSVGILSTVNL